MCESVCYKEGGLEKFFFASNMDSPTRERATNGGCELEM